jgi:SAM-dependent methyltransferase
MNVKSKRNIATTIRLLKAFRLEQKDPDSFYGFLAQDGLGLLSNYTELQNKTVLDIGGGAGYFSAGFRANGAKCFVLEPFKDELFWRGSPPENSILADGYDIPLRSNSVDISFSSNVLEHVRYPAKFITEMIRITKHGGIIFFCFTSWYSPWGGHETSPWHYFGGDFARKRYENKYCRPVKNKYDNSLFKILVKDVFNLMNNLDGVKILETCPRYYPLWTKPMMKVPILSEVLTWNMAVIMEKI